MWIVCGIISIIFCIMAWIWTINKNKKAILFSMCSLSFVTSTLIMEYRMVLNLVKKEDWSALMDVVPSMFSILCGYVVIMLLANDGIIMKNRK